MHGIGNDYIYFDCLDEELADPSAVALKYSDRHFGIGGDGIVMICSSKVADAKMRMFNADGSEGKMCGNAIRCVGKYLYDFNKTDKKELTIETLSGIKQLELFIGDDGKVNFVKVNMGKAVLNPKLIPVKADEDAVINKKVKIADKDYAITCVSMGNPHCVVFENPDKLDIEKVGPLFENDEMFPDRVNTEFVEVISPTELKMRVWERGSGETWACGTGTCAAVVASVLNGYSNKNEDVTVHLRGGDLVINYTDEAVFMTGAAETVFTGYIEL